MLLPKHSTISQFWMENRHLKGYAPMINISVDVDVKKWRESDEQKPTVVNVDDCRVVIFLSNVPSDRQSEIDELHDTLDNINDQIYNLTQACINAGVKEVNGKFFCENCRDYHLTADEYKEREERSKANA